MHSVLEFIHLHQGWWFWSFVVLFVIFVGQLAFTAADLLAGLMRGGRGGDGGTAEGPSKLVLVGCIVSGALLLLAFINPHLSP